MHVPAAELALLRKRRRVATCLLCIVSMAGFLTLYVLSWMLVLSM